MTLSINSNQTNVNSINQIFGAHAFKSATKPIKEVEVEKDDIKAQDTKLIEKDILSKVDVEDIRKSAAQIGEDVSDDDIRYGLTFGRSVLADYSA